MPFIIRYEKADAPARYLAYDTRTDKYKLSHIGRAAAFATTEDALSVIEFFIDDVPSLCALHDDFSVRKVPTDNKRPPKVLQKPPPTLWARLLKDDD